MISTFQKYICIMFNSITHRNQYSGDQNSALNVTSVVLLYLEFTYGCVYGS